MNSFTLSYLFIFTFLIFIVILRLTFSSFYNMLAEYLQMAVVILSKSGS